MRSLRRASRCIALSAILIISMAPLAGCPEPTDDDAANKLPLEGVSLQLLVVDDPALAEAVKKTRGEWKTQTGSTLEVVELAEDEFLATDQSKADAAICASYLLGTLAEKQKIAEIPKAMRTEGQEEWMGIFELSRCHEAIWGTKTLAVPFGSPVLVCYYRSDLLAELGKQPPTTWKEYQELAALLNDRARLKELAPPAEAEWSGTMEPLGPGWGGLMLLARAAPGVQHPDNYSTWFDINTMQPLIDGPPVVRALMQLVATAKHGADDQLEADPAKVREAFWRGQCALAVTWPTSAAGIETSDGDKPASLSAGVAKLPGSNEHYNVDHRRWEKRERGEEIHIPLLATSGRIGVVLKESKNRAAAELLLWLSAQKGNPPPAARSRWTTLFRASQVSSPNNWVEAPLAGTAAATGYAEQTEATFESQQWTFALRIPGRREYLAALDEAVASAVRGEKAPAAALRDAAARWREITLKLGVKRQHAAYLRSLGLEP